MGHPSDTDNQGGGADGGQLLGTWNATTNTPTLSSGDTALAGNRYKVTGAGTYDLGEGSTDYAAGDFITAAVAGGWCLEDNSAAGLDTSVPTTWATSEPADPTIAVGGDQVGATTTYHLMKILWAIGSTITQGVNTVLAGTTKIGFNVLDIVTADTENAWFVSGVTHEGTKNESATFYKFDPSTGAAVYEMHVGNVISFQIDEDGSGNRNISASIAGTGELNISGLSDYADDTAAGVGGLVTNDWYFTTATVAVGDIAIGDKILKIKG